MAVADQHLADQVGHPFHAPLAADGARDRFGISKVLVTEADGHVLHYVRHVDQVHAHRGRGDLDLAAFGFGGVPHSGQALAHGQGLQVQSQGGVGPVHVEKPLLGAQVGGHPLLLAAQGDGLDHASPFGYGRANYVQNTADGVLVGAGDVDEEVLGLRGHGGQPAVDDRREGEHFVIGVQYHRVKLLSIQELLVVPALLVLLEDLGQGHRLLLGQGDEGDGAGRNGLVDEGRLDLIEVVHPDGHLGPLASDGKVQLLLQLHERTYALVVQGDAPDHRSHDVGADALDRWLDLHHYVGGGYVVGAQPQIDIEEGAQRPCQSFDRVQVRPVGEELDGGLLGGRVEIMEVGTDHRNAVQDLPVLHLGTHQGLQVLQVEVDDWHCVRTMG
ncbi:hypothetical protein DSECCO2_328550 [anaerobic digester metagenome]